MNSAGQQLTMTDTIRKNKPELPMEMLPNAYRVEKSNLFGFQQNIALVP